MCGIAGIVSPRLVSAAFLTSMADRIRHRGPDDDGVWIDDSGRVGFGHRRLSILDLSAAGHQPMHSADERFTLSFNGEIYNHTEIRREIDWGFGPVAWRGRSDTETLVEAIVRWGLEGALDRCVGMFALSVWDAHERRLYLARDRFGEKPLYYGWIGGDFLFASDLGAMRLHPRFDNALERRALKQFAARSYVPAPFSIYRNIYKLPPGCILTASDEVASQAPAQPPRAGFASPNIKIHQYWSYRQTLIEGLEQPIGDEASAIEQLEAILSKAVMGQSVADVPVGAFLSGGIDSSTIVALYQKYSSQPVRTYTIGFDDPAYDEAPAARAMAKQLGTLHHEHYVTARDAQDVIPRLASIYGEPFADSSQIPTYLVSAFARQEVKVVLTGDGGDELFGGYNRYFGLARAWQRLDRLGPSIRSIAGNAIGAVPPGAWNWIVRATGRRLPPFVGGKVRKSFRVMANAQSVDDLLTGFLDEWWEEGSPVIGAPDIEAEPPIDFLSSPAERMMLRDAMTYLPDDILCKVDRASMAVSLETRVPFLDHQVAALAARIPIGLKLRGGRGKRIIRQLLYQGAPRELFERPKAGFAIPVGEWIKGPLRAWADELLDPKKLAEEGWFNAAVVQRRWQDHLAGRRESAAALWGILMFQSWLREQKGSLALAA